jgi:hypothetical protein
MRIGGGVLLFVAIIFTISTAKGDNSCSESSGAALTQKCKQDFCEAYASAAVTTVNEAIRTNCKQPDTGRWNPSFDDHLNACLNWAKANDSGNGGMVAMNETFWRAQQLSECLAQKAGVPSPLHFTGTGPFTGGHDGPRLDNFCRGYAFTAGQQTASQVQGDRVIASVQLCGFTGSRWDPNFENHRSACVGWGDQSGSPAGVTSANETTARTQDVIACEVRNITPVIVTPPPPATATVGKDVTMYNVCQGNDLCYLNPGDTLTVDQNPAAGAGCGDSHWIKLTGTSGACKGQTGFVFNNGELSIR